SHGDTSEGLPATDSSDCEDSSDILDPTDASKPQTAPAYRRRTSAAEGAATQLGGTDPATAAFTAHLSRILIDGVGAHRGRTGIESRIVPVAAPLPDIARHVMHAEGRHPQHGIHVGHRKRGDLICREALVLGVAHSVMCGKYVAPRVRLIAGAACGVFPLC